MSMKVNKRLNGNFVIIELGGYLDFETANQLGEQFAILFRNSNSKVIFDFYELQFVGSSGVSNFVKMLCRFNRIPNKPQYVGVSREFMKLFRAFEADAPFEVRELINADQLILEHTSSNWNPETRSPYRA